MRAMRGGAANPSLVSARTNPFVPSDGGSGASDSSARGASPRAWPSVNGREIGAAAGGRTARARRVAHSLLPGGPLGRPADPSLAGGLGPDDASGGLRLAGVEDNLDFAAVKSKAGWRAGSGSLGPRLPASS